MATIKGGTKLENALARLATRLARPGTLRVGFLENATYPNGTPVAAVAAWNNYGTRTAPPRPFFTNMVKAKSPEWPKALANLLRQNDFDAVRALEIAGHAIVGQLKQSIIDTNLPPLSPVTIRRKGFDKPLIDTSHMINSCDSEVREGTP